MSVCLRPEEVSNMWNDLRYNSFLKCKGDESFKSACAHALSVCKNLKGAAKHEFSKALLGV
eukprot:4447681-Alexandrium_andersonii.AAC.1